MTSEEFAPLRGGLAGGILRLSINGTSHKPLHFRVRALYSKPTPYMEANPMCDYSRAHFPNRLAVGGEELVIHRFPSGTMGMGSPDPGLNAWVFRCNSTAVCVPAGAWLPLREIPEWRREQLGISALEEVTFVEQTAEAFRYRDTACFANGRRVLLQRLPPRRRVLNFDSTDPRATELERLAEESASVI